MKCETCYDTGYYGDNGPGRKGNTEYTRCDCQEDVSCTTHHACKCIQERLDRIEAVWQKYKHMDKVMCDTEILDGQNDITDLMLSDLWQAIRMDK